MNPNTLMQKSHKINLCGLVGLALAILGMVIPSIGAYGESITLFFNVKSGGVSLWVLIPLLLAAGAAALYAIRMNLAGWCATILSALIYIIIIVIKKWIVSDYGSIYYSIGWYIAMLGFVIAIAAYWINDLVFKNAGTPRPANAQGTYNHNGYGQAPGHVAPDANQFAQNTQYAAKQANQFANQAPSGMPEQFVQGAQYAAQQTGQFANQAPSGMPEQFVQNAQYAAQQTGQFANQAPSGMPEQFVQNAQHAAQQTNQFANQATSGIQQAEATIDNAAVQAGQLVNDAEQAADNLPDFNKQ